MSYALFFQQKKREMILARWVTAPVRPHAIGSACGRQLLSTERFGVRFLGLGHLLSQVLGGRLPLRGTLPRLHFNAGCQ